MTTKEQLNAMNNTELKAYYNILTMSKNCLTSVKDTELNSYHLELVTEILKERGIK